MTETSPIPDEALRHALESHFLTVDDGAVDTGEFGQLRRLKWTPQHGEPGIRSLEGLQAATSLQELWLEGNDISDLAPVASLPQLRVLDVARNRSLIDLEPLRGHQELRRLMLGRTSVAALAPLREIPNLQVVRLWGFDFQEGSENWRTLAWLRDRGVKLALDPDLDVRLDDWIGRAAIAERDHSDIDPVRARLRGWELHELASGWISDGPAWRDADGNTLLHRIPFEDLQNHQKIEMIERLAEAGVDVDAINHRHETALTLCVWEMRAPEVVEALLDVGADVDYPAERPPVLQTFVHLREAGRKGFGRVFELLQMLVDRGARLTNPRVFRQLVQFGPTETVEIALKQGADPNHREIRSTPLMAAAEGGRTDVVELLLEAGADPRRTDVQGRNALHTAGTVELYDRFRSLGADPGRPSKFSPNALFAAVERMNGATELRDGDVSLVRRILDDGVAPQARGYRRRTVLHALVEDYTMHGNSAVVADTIGVLVEGGADPNALTAAGATPFDVARDERDRQALAAVGGVAGAEVIDRLADCVVVDGVIDWEVAWRLVDAGCEERLWPHADRFSAEASKKGGIATRLANACGPTSRPVVGWFAGGTEAEGLEVGGLLHLVAESAVPERDELLLELLDAGADPERLSPTGDSALRQYLVYGNSWSEEVLHRLTTPETQDRPRWSPPIVVAARKRQTWLYEERDLTPVDAILDFLVDAGARLDTPRILTALCGAGRTDLVRRALQAGADSHHVTHEHDTAVQAAVSGDHVEILELLLDAGADPDQGMFVHGQVPVHAARSLAAFELLVGHGASVDARSQHAGESALFAVAARSDLEVSEQLAIIERLQALGQTLQDANRHGRRAIEWLESREEPEIREFLGLTTSEEPGSDR